MSETITRLIKELIAARYVILVSVRPLAPARFAFNRTIDAILYSLSETDETKRSELEALKLTEDL